MSPALNGSSAIRRSKHSNALKIIDGITFDFYMGLPHIHVLNAPFFISVSVLTPTLNPTALLATIIRLVTLTTPTH